MQQNGKYKLEIEHRVTTVESGICRIEKLVEEIKTNHLVHLANDIKEIKDSQVWLMRTVAGGILAFLFSLALIYFE